MAALQHFFDAERTRRGWSMREAAKRSKISPSKAYAIANGDDNVEFETFENIAAAFSMSPAELAVAIGKGAAGDDPRRVPIHAALRDVPDEQLATVELMIRSLAVQPVNKGLRNGLRDDTDNSHSGGRRILSGRGRTDPQTGDPGTLPLSYGSRTPVLAFVRNAFWNLKRGIQTPMPLIAAQLAR